MKTPPKPRQIPAKVLYSSYATMLVAGLAMNNGTHPRLWAALFIPSTAVIAWKVWQGLADYLDHDESDITGEMVTSDE